MKEATGELSTTVIAIVAIAAILAIFTVFLLPTLRSQIALTQACNSGPTFSSGTKNEEGISCDGNAATADKTGVSWTCTYWKSNKQQGSKACKN